MAPPLDMTVDLQPLQRGAKRFRAIEREQLPFATARALTATAAKAQQAVRKDMPSRFNIRSQRVIRGIRTVRAEKRDWPLTTAKVGSVDEFMALHVTGGTKRARSGGSVLIPTRAIKRTSSGRIRKAQRPAALRAAGKSYVEGGIIRLRGKARRRGGLRLLYLRRPSARIEATWPLQDVVARSVRVHFPREFRRSMVRAIKTSRQR